ncbi:MAG: DNA-protecting protein DprA [Bacteroidales bacterium]|nr:DNA-protecting protein DprA [Bacteroidales bacterium]
MEENRRFQVAYSLLPFGKLGVDKALLNFAGSPEAVFCDPTLKSLPHLPEVLRQALTSRDSLLREADEVLERVNKLGCRLTFFGDTDYPHRLTFCDDAPVLLFYKGKMALNAPKVLAIVGTRKPTPAGREWTEALVKGLAVKFPDLVIVSGLAYGIDITAHIAALNQQLPTVAVLAHGLDILYPYAHAHTAELLQTSGCLLSELKPGTAAEGWRFLQRNRIVAGLSDACIVVESGEKGGSLNTASRAFEYGRPVYTRPGRPSDNRSKGSNNLIKHLVASLIDGPDDLLSDIGWSTTCSRKANVEPTLFRPLTSKEQAILKHVSKAETVGLNELLRLTGLSVPDILSATMQLEMDDMIEALPGNCYRAKKG